MSQQEPKRVDGRRNNGGPRFKVRDDDRRGVYAGTKRSEYAHKPTDTKREMVRKWIKVLTIDQVAIKMGMGRDTLLRHYREELDAGVTDAVAAIGAKVLAQAMNGDKASQFFFLKTRGKWSQRVEVTGPGGGPVQTVDPALLASLTDEEFDLYERLCERLGTGEQDDDGDGEPPAGPDGGEA